MPIESVSLHMALPARVKGVDSLGALPRRIVCQLNFVRNLGELSPDAANMGPYIVVTWQQSAQQGVSELSPHLARTFAVPLELTWTTVGRRS